MFSMGVKSNSNQLPIYFASQWITGAFHMHQVLTVANTLKNVTVTYHFSTEL